MGMRSNCKLCDGIGTVEAYDNGKAFCFKCDKLVKGAGTYTPAKPITKQELRRIDQIWNNEVSGMPGSLTDYHIKKGIKQHIGPAKAKTGHGNVLVVPIYNSRGTLMSLQQINGDSEKRFIKGGKISGNYCIITRHCRMETKPNTDLVFVVEGYATGLSAYQVFGRDVVVAFNAGNLKHVVGHFKGKTLVILADNDTDSQTGITKAKEACEGRGNVKVILTPEAGDFNDYVVKHGIEHTKQVYAHLLEQILGGKV